MRDSLLRGQSLALSRDDHLRDMVMTDNAPAHPRYKYFKESKEERFLSFLGLPLFEAKVKQLLPSAQILYSNANQDAAAQQSQADGFLDVPAVEFEAGRSGSGIHDRNVVTGEMREFRLEGWIGLRRLVGLLEIENERHEGLGDETAAENAEMPALVGARAEAVG